jgi:hypothetical protein
VGGPDLRTFYLFFAGVKNFAYGAIFCTFSGLPFYENFVIEPISPKISPAAPFNVYFLLLCLSRGPQKASCPGPVKTLIRPCLSTKILASEKPSGLEKSVFGQFSFQPVPGRLLIT